MELLSYLFLILPFAFAFLAALALCALAAQFINSASKTEALCREPDGRV